SAFLAPGLRPTWIALVPREDGSDPAHIVALGTRISACAGLIALPCGGCVARGASLSRHKRYPRRAQSRRQEGTGRLFFVVEQNGRVSAMRLQKSSGHRLLDDEILAILGRVGTFPPIPGEIGVARLELVVPINFSLR
ncbi:MAG: TonB family protein, partial [Pseudomonadota bacterium]